MPIEQVKKFDYAMPYFIKPDELLRDDFKTEVQGIVTIDGRGISYDFNWESDSLGVRVILCLTQFCRNLSPNCWPIMNWKKSTRTH